MSFGAIALLSVCAWVTRRKAREVEARHPPAGRFVNVDDVRLHFVEHGAPSAPVAVLLHGNGSMSTEIELSGLVARLASRYRVIVFDRPGYGYSDRPNGLSCAPSVQARLFLHALESLEVREAMVMGHSWGALVAIAMGLASPRLVRGVVLVSGYYTPSLRLDMPLLIPMALPLVGTLLCHTVSPLLGRLLWPLLVRRIFAPAALPSARVQRYPIWLSLRPGSLRTTAVEAVMTIPQAALLWQREPELRIPVAIVAGSQDLLLSTAWHSRRLHRRLPGSRLYLVPNAGHMVHHTAPQAVVAAVDDLAGRTGRHGEAESASAASGLCPPTALGPRS
jgi:pimeloyl-ACP methyl ester carboxylesterase